MWFRHRMTPSERSFLETRVSSGSDHRTHANLPLPFWVKSQRERSNFDWISKDYACFKVDNILYNYVIYNSNTSLFFINFHSTRTVIYTVLALKEE